MAQRKFEFPGVVRPHSHISECHGKRHRRPNLTGKLQDLRHGSVRFPILALRLLTHREINQSGNMMIGIRRFGGESYGLNGQFFGAFRIVSSVKESYRFKSEGAGLIAPIRPFTVDMLNSIGCFNGLRIIPPPIGDIPAHELGSGPKVLAGPGADIFFGILKDRFCLRQVPSINM